MDGLSVDQLTALLEDTQASLAAAFARVETYRLQNRQLREELSQLRSQVLSGGGAPPGADGQQRASNRASSIAAPQASTSGVDTRNGPVYVADVAGSHPVTIVTGGKKAPANLIISRDFVDFVESRARIHAKDFVGITNVKTPQPPSASSSETDSGTWQFIWNKDNVAQRLIFEAGVATRETLHRHTQRWLGVDGTDDGEDETSAAAGEVVPPKALVLVPSMTMQLVGEPSQILKPEHLCALASGVPPLERLRPWQLTYSTKIHGISLGTLYRKSAAQLPTLLIVKDSAGYVFGSYSGDGWRVAPRFYGSGETFVFQLEPHRIMYPWRSMAKVKNDFFQYATLECIAVGGLGHFAIHVDSELLQGSSGTCGTFGSPCLAGRDEFKVSQLEVWQAVMQ